MYLNQIYMNGHVIYRATYSKSHVDHHFLAMREIFVKALSQEKHPRKKVSFLLGLSRRQD